MPVRPEAPAARALARLYSPAPQRAALGALFALEREIGDSTRQGVDHQVAHARLEWWRGECARAAQGAALHPLTRELAAAFAAAPVQPPAQLAGLVDVALWDLAAATFESRRELGAYCARWSAAVIEPLAGLALPAPEVSALRALGSTLRELELLLALAEDARLGRVRLPLAELEAAHTAAEQLACPPWPTALAQLVAAQHRRLRAVLADSVAALGAGPQGALRGLVVWAALLAAASRRAERRLPAALPRREDHTLLDGWRAWRAARRALAGRGLRPFD